MKDDKEINDLTDKWCKYVVIDHHKHGDVHFTITLDYAYGEISKFEIDHYGYIGDEFHYTARSLYEAEIKLLKGIKKMIKSEAVWVDDVLSRPNEYDSHQLAKANKYNELFRAN